MQKAEAEFEIRFMYAAWVPPYNGIKDADILTKVLRGTSNASNYFSKIYYNALADCKFEIDFKSDGNQMNTVRNSILGIMKADDTAEKKKHANGLAKKLHRITDERNGKGLFVIIEGVQRSKTRIILSRFRADEVLYTKVGKNELDLDLLKEAFSKKSHFYKLAVFEDQVTDKSFWKGYAIDKQISNNSYKTFTQFWLDDFLEAYSSITDIQGTSQFTKIIKAILKTTDSLDDQEQIVSSLISLKHKKNNISISSYCQTYLNPELTDKIKTAIADDFLFTSTFKLDGEVYKKELGNTVALLNNGVMISAPTFNYENVVNEKKNNEDGSIDVIVSGKLNKKNIGSQQRKQPAK